MPKKAIIIGAGPAGLTAAYELLEKTDIIPIILEVSSDLGGLAKTINYKGNRIDIGGHRFFSKSDRVMKWWQNILPIEGARGRDDLSSYITYQKKSRPVELQKDGPDPKKEDRVMLIRKRLSRIFFLRTFFDYPVSLSRKMLSRLGPIRTIKIGLSYVRALLFPIRPENSLEDFFVNRFGRELYQTFFQDYTEKVWGVPCRAIKPEWGAQRIKGLSVNKTLLHAIKKLFQKTSSIKQKEIETSLIEQFLYPKFGPGQMWETVGSLIQEHDGNIFLCKNVVGIEFDGQKIQSIEVEDTKTKERIRHEADYFFSSMPIKDLVAAMTHVPEEVRGVADGLAYRDFITVGLLLKKLSLKERGTKEIKTKIEDNWIYIQEPDVKVGRIQIFNNWSPYLVKNPDTIWMGLEYFCNEGDELWKKSDQDMKHFAQCEMERIGMIHAEDVIDGTVIRVKKTYPAYFGSYDQFHIIRKFTDSIPNLFLIGRNGMHRYNNQDHSMLTAMTAVENIINGITSKDNIWAVNTEEEYHESRSSDMSLASDVSQNNI